MRKIINEVVKDYVADEKAVKKSIAPILSSIKSSAKSLKISCTVSLGGSIAKGTLLAGDFDIDVFVTFASKYKGKDISSLLEKILKKAKLNAKRVHGSRDYFHHFCDDLKMELVPVLKVTKGTPENVTDMSPLHVEWLKKRINQKLANDIRVAKLFCKSLQIYGAESFIKGFSGHVLDILIIHYKGFDKLIKAVAKWKIPVVIDTMKYHKGKAQHILNQSKIGPLIIVDPVDKNRNAAAAINEESLKTFISAAKKFVKKPSDKFFKPYIFDLKKIVSGKGKVVLVMPKVSKGKSDVVGAKLLKQFETIKNELTREGFDLKRTGWFWDKKEFSALWFKTDGKLLPKTRVHDGPYLEQETHCKAFKRKYRGAKKRAGRLVAEVKISHRTPESLIKQLSKNSEIMVYQS